VVVVVAGVVMVVMGVNRESGGEDCVGCGGGCSFFYIILLTLFKDYTQDRCLVYVCSRHVYSQDRCPDYVFS